MPHWEVGKIGGNGPIKVLLIEDDTGFARMVQEMIAEIDGGPFTFERVENLEKGIDRVKKGRIDVVLLDLLLPDSEGIFTFFKIREVCTDIPVVVLSALEDDETAILAVREGAQDYLFKGIVNPAVLVRSIRHSIERKRNRDELRQTREELEELLGKKEAEIADLKKRLDAALKDKK
ncbi:MAG: response regulator [Deltaproteobacteria bacterium]|nr:response regulator [Candidatus Zymogenaceae bacterium]